MNRIDHFTTDMLRYLEQRDAQQRALAQRTDQHTIADIIGAGYNPGLPDFDQSGDRLEPGQRYHGEEP